MDRILDMTHFIAIANPFVSIIYNYSPTAQDAKNTTVQILSLVSFAEKVRMPKQFSVSLLYYCSGNSAQNEESERRSGWRCDKPTKDPKKHGTHCAQGRGEQRTPPLHPFAAPPPSPQLPLPQH